MRIRAEIRSSDHFVSYLGLELTLHVLKNAKGGDKYRRFRR